MPLPKPQLDNRRYDQLVEEARALLPRSAPDWTDHNASDPGMTLIELYAWLSEMAMYGLDRVPDEAVRAYLRLVGVTPRPALAASAVVLLSTASDLVLPPGLQLGDVAGAISFESTQALTVSAAQLVRVVDGDGGDASATNLAGSGFLPFGVAPRRDSAVYFGFDRVMAATGAELSAYVWTSQPDLDARTRARLIEQWEYARRLRAEHCPSTLRTTTPWWLHHDARLRWEYRSTAGEWRVLEILVDETRALTLSGSLRFRAPADHAAGGFGDPWLFWLRARLQSGAYECAPRIARVGFNAVACSHASRVPDAQLGVSLGHAEAVYDIGTTPVLAGSTELLVTLPSGPDAPWTEVPNFDASGAHDRHYCLDCERGRVRFGNGLRGCVPAADAALRLALRQGGGTPGNVAPGTLSVWRDNLHNQTLVPGWSALFGTLAIEQAFAALGGSDAESLKASIARALADQREIVRAITTEDFAELARSVPGVPVARSRAVSEYYPDLPCVRAAGRIAVVVVPDCPGAAPMPTPGMLRAVAAFLELRRTPACAVEVIAPSYARVIVSATLRARAGAQPGAIERAAVDAIAEFFHPLRGGPERAGWPVGRAVYRSELLALLSALDGVGCVEQLGIQGEADAAPRCENLAICPHQLIVPGAHRLRVIGAPPQRIVDRSIAHECP